MARILIVDDDEMLRVLARSILEEAGHELLFASDSASALEIYEKEHVDLVVTDLVMPGGSGLGLIRELMERHSGVSVIAISGASPEHLITAQDFGALKTLYKPFKRRELLQTVEDVLREGPPSRRDNWR